MTTPQGQSESVVPPSRQFYGWTNAALFFTIQFGSSGFVYFAYSVIFPAMVAMMNWDRGGASVGQSLGFLILGLCYPVTAWMIGRKGVRFTMTVGLLVMLSGLLTIIFWVSQIWQWTLVWGLVIGLSLGLTAPICGQTVIIQWFNARRATALGIIMTGNAIGGFVAQPVLAKVMAQYGTWQAGWMVSAVMVVVALILTQFIVNQPADIGQWQDGVPPSTTRADGQRAHKQRTYRSTRDWSVRDIFRTKTAYLLMIVNISYLGTGSFLLAHGFLHLTDVGFSNLQASSLVGLFILGSGLGRIPAGWLGDHFEMRGLLSVILMVMLTCFVMLWQTRDLMIMSVVATLFGASYGAFFVLIPALTSNYFGERVFASVNAIFAPLLLPFVATVPAGTGFIFDMTGSYNIAFLVGSIALTLSLLAAFLLFPPVHREDQKTPKSS